MKVSRSNYRLFLMMFVLVGVFLVSNVSVQAKDVYRWKCPTAYTSVMPDFKILQDMSKNLEKMSAGRLIIKFFPNGALIPGKEIYSAVKSETVEMGSGWPNWWIGKNPAWNLMNDQPFGFRNKDAFLMWYYFGDGKKFANELTAKDGILWFPGLFTSTQTGAFCNKPIKSLSEAKGKKFRIGPGLHMAVLQKNGIQVVSLAPQEIYGSLDRGVVDMVEWLTPGTDYPLKFHEVAPYLLAPAWWQPSGLSDFLVNKKAFEKLPNDLQAMLETAMRDASIYGGFKLLNLDRKYMKKLVDEGVTVFKWPEEDLKTLKADTLEVMNEYAEKYPMFKKIWESQKKFQKEYLQYKAYMAF